MESPTASLVRCPPSRRETILRDVSSVGTALEFGPIMRRVFDKKENEVYFADYASRAVLAEEYKNNRLVDVDRIPEIDFIAGDSYISEVCSIKFDTIVASHVIEHVPDLIGWLKSCSNVLNRNGIISLAIPDKRYTFDILREKSTFFQAYVLYLEGRRQPSLSQIADHFSNVADVRAKDVWAGQTTPQNARRLYPNAKVRRILDDARRTEAYVNCHCWIFDVQSLQELLREFAELGLIDLKIVSVVEPRKNQGEFFVSLTRN